MFTRGRLAERRAMNHSAGSFVRWLTTCCQYPFIATSQHCAAADAACGTCLTIQAEIGTSAEP